MNNKEAIRILQDELKHTEIHLHDKNKAVEFYEEMKLFCEAFRLAIKALGERPQGEWIACTKSGMPLTEYGRMMGEKWYGFKCSQCKFIYKGNALIESPFCQECGAQMKGGAE